MSPRKCSNPKIVLTSLADYGPSSKWDLKQNTKLAYPRVNEAINSLTKANLVKVVDVKTSKKNLKMKIYDLTFKGVIGYLASLELNPPRIIGYAGETKDDFFKRFHIARKVYFLQIERVNKLLKHYGEHLNFEIFKEIDWLSKNYGLFIFEIILKVSKNLQSQSTRNPYRTSLKLHKTEEKKLLEDLEMFRKNPSLRKMKMWRSFGKGNKEEFEVDLMSDVENKILRSKMEFTILQKGENLFLKETFAYEFFELIVPIKRKSQDSNKSLYLQARFLLNKRRKMTINRLEKVVKQLGNFGDEENRK